MLRKALPALISVATLASAQVHAEDKLILKSVNVDLPFGDPTSTFLMRQRRLAGNCLMSLMTARLSAIVIPSSPMSSPRTA
jgi:hypothetical protein